MEGSHVRGNWRKSETLGVEKKTVKSKEREGKRSG